MGLTYSALSRRVSAVAGGGPAADASRGPGTCQSHDLTPSTRYDGGINFYSYVLNNPVNRVDPWGLDPGQTFITQHAAAIDALDFVCKDPDQFFPFWEWGAYIYQIPGGYTYEYPRTSRDHEYVNLGDPSPNRLNRSYYHTHTETNDFSPDDRRIGFAQARAAGLTGAYMAGPGCGVIRFADLDKNTEVQLR